MSAFTVANLAEIDDMAPKFGFEAIHEARFATKPLGCEQLGLAYYRIKPGKSQPFAHKHAEQEEVYVLLSGSAKVHLDDDVRDLKQLDAVRISGEVVRWIEAGDDGAEVLAFGAPALSNHENDAEIIQLEGAPATV